MTWIERKDFNWCFNCWFNAKIESKETEIGTNFICLNCGVCVNKPNSKLLEKIKNSNQSYKFDEKEYPRFFTEEEWQKYWEENIKI